jgi:protein-tyrosine-phosphatase
MNEPYIYVVLIGLCILVFSFLFAKPKKLVPPQTPQIMQEVEETMEGFMAELEEDNKKLLDTITHMKESHNQSLHKMTERMERLEQEFQQERQDWKRLVLMTAEKTGQAPARSALPPQAQPLPQPEPLPVQEEPQKPAAGIRGRYEEVLRLHDDGKSVDYIARKCGLNKGEVNLIIQLALQEEEANAKK